MKSASVSEAKNGLSALLDEVRQGETVLITHHGKPVARLEPCQTLGLADDEAAAALVKPRCCQSTEGPTRRDKAFWPGPFRGLPKGLSASQMVVAERSEGL